MLVAGRAGSCDPAKLVEAFVQAFIKSVRTRETTRWSDLMIITEDDLDPSPDAILTLLIRSNVSLIAQIDSARIWC